MKYSELLKHIKRLALKQSCDVWKITHGIVIKSYRKQAT